MAKKITGYIKLQIPAGRANPSPPVGPALGQQGVNIPQFCKIFETEAQVGSRVKNNESGKLGEIIGFYTGDDEQFHGDYEIQWDDGSKDYVVDPNTVTLQV